jgi:hypothetical protein
MANNKDNRESVNFLSFGEYVNFAYLHGFKNLMVIAEELGLTESTALNLSSGRTPTSEERGRHFFLDARFRGWM